MRLLRTSLVAVVSLAAVLTYAQTRPEWLNNGPEFIYSKFLGLMMWQWIGLIVVAIIGFTVAMIGREGVILALLALQRLIHTEMSHSVRQLIRRAVAVLIFAWTCLSLTGELVLPLHDEVVVAKILKIGRAH